jgi:tetratricopeptide (TPR) repeat protein
VSKPSIPIACILFWILLTPTAQAQNSGASNNQGAAPKTGAASPSPATDVEQVQRVNAARREYQLSLEALRTHYIAVGDVERVHWTEDELTQYHRILKQAYRLELDVPPPTLQGHQNIPEANELYRRALSYKEGGIPFGSTYIDNQRRAELLFQQLLSNFPNSDKIDDAAYQLGDIYESSAFKQYRRAAQYFERCFQWNSKTHLDARTRAARLYDQKLQERSRAIELYRDVVNRETDPKRIEEAKKRLTDLSTVKK